MRSVSLGWVGVVAMFATLATGCMDQQPSQGECVGVVDGASATLAIDTTQSWFYDVTEGSASHVEARIRYRDNRVTADAIVGEVGLSAWQSTASGVGVAPGSLAIGSMYDRRLRGNFVVKTGSGERDMVRCTFDLRPAMSDGTYGGAGALPPDTGRSQ